MAKRLGSEGKISRTIRGLEEGTIESNLDEVTRNIGQAQTVDDAIAGAENIMDFESTEIPEVPAVRDTLDMVGVDYAPDPAMRRQDTSGLQLVDPAKAVDYDKVQSIYESSGKNKREAARKLGITVSQLNEYLADISSEQVVAPESLLENDNDLDGAYDSLSDDAKNALREWTLGSGRDGNTLTRLRDAALRLWHGDSGKSTEKDVALLEEIYQSGETVREKLRPYVDSDGKITLYRGLRTKGDGGSAPPLQSLTLSERTAKNFAGEDGAVERIKVSIDDVVAEPGGAEREIIVRATQDPATAPRITLSDKQKGKKSTAYTPQGEKIDTEFAVVDVAGLITSNDDTGNINPNYPAELQPRDR
ncbi:MAG: hypothetical protein WD709_04625, partial [Gammaproteobacteria bacterium]